MKKHFSKKIQMNKTDPAIMRRKELANAALAQTKEDETTQRQALEIVVLQTQQIQALEAKLEQQLANIATNSGNSIPGRIPATIDTNNSGSTGGGGSTTSTVTKEEMMQMFTQFTKNFKQGQCTEITPTATKGKEKKKRKFRTNYIPNDLGNGQRSKRRYPESTSYCPSCGYDIKPMHTPVTCTNRKKNHNGAATITNKMGGVTTNCHFAE